MNNSPANTPANTATTQPPFPLGFRIGEGWDTHQLVAGRELWLGGVLVAHDKGLLGHSDADVLLHAITDALLGAAGLGDIGTLFPDTDPAYKGADSRLLLTQAMQRVSSAGWQVGNIDCTIIAQRPRLASYKPAMAASIAACLSIAPSQDNVKGKTDERMGPVGEERSMEARAVVLLVRG